MKKQVFLIISLIIMNSVCASESDLYPPPGYAPENGTHRQPIVDSDPLPHVFKEESQSGINIQNSSCVCVCPNLINVSIIPILHRIKTRLSLSLCGTQDSIFEDNFGHKVENHNNASKKTSSGENKAKEV